MKFAYGLPVILLAATNVMVVHQVAVALEPPQVNAIAKKITVRISGPEAGTGVMVKKEGNNYTVLTNWHVVDTPGTYIIQTQNGRRYRINYSEVTRLSEEVDLAVVEFQSKQNYETAKIGNSDKVTEGTTVHAAGWVTPDRVCLEPRCYNFSTGNLIGIRNRSKDGYGWIYSNEVRRGMSGGPVLDEEGRLVGINGRAKTSPPFRDFLAIPINIYVNTPPPLTKIQFTLAKTLSGDTTSFNSVAFSPDGRTLASGSWDNSIKIWDAATGKQLKTLTGHSKSVSSIAFSPNGRTLASGSWDNSIKIWDAATGKQLKTLTGHSEWVSSIAFSPNGRTLASGGMHPFDLSGDNSIKIWDVASLFPTDKLR
ncbi:MAG: trypsin-like peptidase domain-containing protein [Nostocaceae cyanobacterium]|nr:trypsin-like peptidase domain-containing protein [Nostocaceae cyanobacterium]